MLQLLSEEEKERDKLMRVLSQSEIDNMLASLLADPGVLPGAPAVPSNPENESREAETADN